MKKRLLTSIMIFVFLMVCVFPSFGTSDKTPDGGFSDVPRGYWAYDAIKWMLDNRIVEGAGEGRFQPNRPVSRDEYAKMMVLTLKLDLINPERGSFLDIKKGGWQYKYVETAKPYMTGFRTASGDYFHPADAAVREDMAVALVKALRFDSETADLSLLAQFADSSSISPNLAKYVAIAVKHNLMKGFDKDGKRMFGAKNGLDRASAATLLYNAFKENEEKITYDEEKVTYDNGSNTSGSGIKYPASRISQKVSGDKLILSWDKITSPDFSGYKVVISKFDSTPKYPENGYLAYITDRNTTSIEVRAGDPYNGGDIGGRLKSGISYYYSITVLYNDKKVAGNVVRERLPAVDNDDDIVFTTPAASKLIVNSTEQKLVLNWEKISSLNFAGYKVVISKSDSTPVYPDNGYLEYITDRNITSITVKAGDRYNGGDFGGELRSGVTYYFSITVLYNDGKAAGNVVRARLP